MNWIDIVIVVILGLGVLSGARRGLVKQIIGLVSLVASFLIGYLYMEGTGSWLGAQAGIPAEYATIAGFLAVFLGAMLGFVILSRFLDRVVSNTPLLGGLNRIVGAGLGLLSSGLLLSLLLYLCSVIGLPPDEVRTSSMLYESAYQFLPDTWDLATRQFPGLEGLTDRFPAWF